MRYARAIHTRLGKISLKYFIDNLNIIYQTDSFQTDFQKWRLETRQLSVFSSEQWKDFITTITTTTNCITTLHYLIKSSEFDMAVLPWFTSGACIWMRKHLSLS